MLKKLFILFKIARQLALSDALKVISKIHKPPIMVQLIVKFFSISLSKKDYELKNLSDEEIDYTLYDVTHPNGTDSYGTVIENMSIFIRIEQTIHWIESNTNNPIPLSIESIPSNNGKYPEMIEVFSNSGISLRSICIICFHILR